jgi:hypothetical protein
MLALLELCAEDRQRQTLRRLFPLAACLMILGLGLYFWFQHRPTQRSRIALPIVLIDPRSSEPQTADWPAAVEAYQQGDYQTVLAILGEGHEDSASLFYRGVAAYMLGRDRIATSNFEEAIKANASWRNPSMWYLANIFLDQGKTEEGRRLLHELAKSEDTDLSALAQELLRGTSDLKTDP